MSERRPCIRCDRAIDAWSKLCPFCNWDQSKTDLPRETAPRQVADAAPPPDDLKEQIKRKGLIAGAGVLVLIASFLVGMVINSDDTPDDAPLPVSEQEQKAIPPVKRADTPLVPTNERGGVEQPITSAPVASVPTGTSDGYDRSDATAVSSEEYNQLAKRAKAEKERMSALIDPRSLSGAAYAQGAPPAPRRIPSNLQQASPAEQQAAAQQAASGVAPASPRARRAVRTRPVPQYQPLPNLHASGTARLTLIIGSDGRVRDVNIERALSRNTADLVSAVQKWRFKPATEDGEPIAAPYSVDISFGGQ
jgi:TonB family protein